ncbi:MAG: hypothetical protein D6675_14590 [Gemmatimonadetes bacterium]|nr:MAG: hypothetical protein D6675_14590 [Gemmatimonadota bacterium]
MLDIRRDPIVGAWVLVRDLVDVSPTYPPVQTGESTHCRYCQGHEGRLAPAIHTVTDEAGNWRVRVVPHPQPRLVDTLDYKLEGVGFYDTVSGTGSHEVIVESPEHGVELSQMPLAHVEQVIEVYRQRLHALRENDYVRYALLFKKYLPRPQESTSGHSIAEILAIPATPLRIKHELDTAKQFFAFKERCQFCDIIDQEMQFRERVVDENGSMIAICPFASRFPFEVWILPKEHQHDFTLLTAAQIRDLAVLLQGILRLFQHVLNSPPYTYVLHTSPNLIPHRGYWKTLSDDYHWRLEITPKLFDDVGFEYSTGFYINHTPPEVAAQALRNYI